MIWWIIIPTALFGFFMLSRASMYRNFFSEEHLRELANICAELSQEAKGALSTQGEAPNEAPKPPHRITSAGMAVVYTLRRQDPKIIAHLSLSYKGGWFAAAAASILVAYLRRMLNLPAQFTLLGVSSNGVYHAEWSLDSIPEISTQSPQEVYPLAAEEGRQLSALIANHIEA